MYYEKFLCETCINTINKIYNKDKIDFKYFLCFSDCIIYLIRTNYIKEKFTIQLSFSRTINFNDRIININVGYKEEEIIENNNIYNYFITNDRQEVINTLNDIIKKIEYVELLG